MRDEMPGASRGQKVLIIGFFVLPIVLTLGVLLSPAFRKLRAQQLAKNEQLLTAVEAGDLSRVKALLQAGANVNTCTSGGLTALSLAVIRGYGEIALLLLDHGASIDARDKSGDRQQRSPGNSPVHYAAIYGRTRILERMLQAGVSPNLRDKNGRTLLMLAAENGHVDTVQLLLCAGADANARSALGETVLDCARRSKNPEVVRLIEGAIRFPAGGQAGG